MHIVIAGCGRVGSDLAEALSEAEHDVSVVDESQAKLDTLGDAFNGHTVVGLPYDVNVLESAGIHEADAFVAVTPNDNANVMAAQVAKKVFNVPRTIARLDDPGRAESYRILNVDYVAGAQLVSKVLFEQIVESEFDYHVTFSGGEIEIVDMYLGPKADGLAVADFEIDERLRVSAIKRKGQTFIPGPRTSLRENDMIVAAARHGVLRKVRKFLVVDEADER